MKLQHEKSVQIALKQFRKEEIKKRRIDYLQEEKQILTHIYNDLIVPAFKSHKCTFKLHLKDVNDNIEMFTFIDRIFPEWEVFTHEYEITTKGINKIFKEIEKIDKELTKLVDKC